MADRCDAFLVGAKIHVIYQGQPPFGVYVQQWHTDELYSMVLEHEGCKVKRQKYHLEAPLSFLWCSNALPLLVEIFLARSH